MICGNKIIKKARLRSFFSQEMLKVFVWICQICFPKIAEGGSYNFSPPHRFQE